MDRMMYMTSDDSTYGSKLKTLLNDNDLDEGRLSVKFIHDRINFILDLTGIVINAYALIILSEYDLSNERFSNTRRELLNHIKLWKIDDEEINSGE